MSPIDVHAGSAEIHRLALEKAGRVLGQERAARIVGRLLAEHGLELRTAQDLMRLSVLLGALGGIEAAVGAMLGVAAVLRGATRE